MKKHDLTKTHLHRASPGMALYAAFAGVTMAAMLCQPVFAATVWEKANEIMKDVYMEDDTGLLCDAYNTTEIGDGDCTRVSVMDKERFQGWLSDRENRLRSISDL